MTAPLFWAVCLEMLRSYYERPKVDAAKADFEICEKTVSVRTGPKADAAKADFEIGETLSR